MPKDSSKKPFDKKKWRERTYSKKFKVQQWEERRKKAVIRQYVKELKKIKADSGSQWTTSQTRIVPSEESSSKRPPSAYQLAQQEFERKKRDKQEKHEEAMRRKADRKEALEKYKEKKMQRYKKLSKKTAKGQPVMKDRIEMLLEKIQSDCS